ncbi:MAG: LacI family DNA-binding transcriptional regulator [Brooklawnia sp.]|uniref:LacI family DNA-binding transcriptional regulator n=1 Tax=Brooklawnia sp. TaxID=2699740 RepID=UPI003C718F51
MATIKDVAHTAGVSVASVSRVFSNHESVSPQMREKVLAAAEEHSFRPNAMGRALRRTGTRTIGLVVSDLLNPFFTQLARAVEDAAREAGYLMIVGNADEKPEQQDLYVQTLLERQVDGMIVVPTIETSELLREAAELNRHLVLLDRPANDVHAPLIASDTAPAITQLVDHLVATGRRDIGVIAGSRAAGTARERVDALRSALAVHGIELPPERIWAGTFRRESGLACMTRMLDERTTPEALLISNGEMALGALEALTTHAGGVPSVPNDIALACIDDLDMFAWLRPSVTAIAQPTRELGRHAFEALLDRINGHEVSATRIACTLHLRASTAPRVAHHASERHAHE